jgi:hypothetical protein
LPFLLTKTIAIFPLLFTKIMINNYLIIFYCTKTNSNNLINAPFKILSNSNATNALNISINQRFSNAITIIINRLIIHIINIIIINNR